VFAALSVYLIQISESASAYCIILLFTTALVLLRWVMLNEDNVGIIMFPLLLIIGGLISEIYSYSVSQYSTNVKSLVSQVIRFYFGMIIVAIGLYLTAFILQYLVKKILKKM
jgi:hypothetical protein